MLKQFSVENFKGFKDRITLDLGHPCNYGFNQNVIYDNSITKGIIYGINGCGKSNFGLALFDIVRHLTDKERLRRNYECYLNLAGRKSFATFEYIFSFWGEELIYRYEKISADQLKMEQVIISGEEQIYYDYSNNEGYTRLKGTENLNKAIQNDASISRVKYVSSNSILEDNLTNKVFQSFMQYVNRMLLFYSLDERGYQGFMTGGQSIAEGIIESGKLEEFQLFLQNNGQEYQLKEVDVDGRKSIYCKFGEKEANFFHIASTGTKSLALFYYWYIKMQDASLVYIDEFDAFYHFELAQNIIRALCKIDKVQILATTHNTDLMTNDLLRPDCYFIIRNNKIYSITDSTEKELRKAHNLQKMYKAGAFDGEKKL